MTGCVRHLGEIDWQQASQAKGYATDERMRGWGVWQRGSPHKRDAVRQLCLKLNKVLG